jgi:hypothetical protein
MGVLLALVIAGAAVCARPAPARADATATPIATNFIAKVSHAPAGIQATVVDGYLQLWMRVPTSETVEVIDQLGAPYLRFDRSGVYVNHDSIEYYVSQIPVPALPPRNLSRTSPPEWVKVSSGHDHTWRDGRLHALTQEAIAPDTHRVGSWSIPLRVDGRPGRVTGAIWHREAPSIAWLWPIAVFVLVVAAAWRLRRPELERQLTAALVALNLATLAIAAVVKELHGRPTVSPPQYVLLFIILAVIAAAAVRLATRRAGHLLRFVTAFVTLWAGLTFAPVLTHHYPMLALTGTAARILTVLLIGASLSLILLSVRVAADAMAESRAARRRPVVV